MGYWQSLDGHCGQFCSAVLSHIVDLAADAVDLLINTLDLCSNQEELDAETPLCKKQWYW